MVVLLYYCCCCFFVIIFTIVTSMIGIVNLDCLIFCIYIFNLKRPFETQERGQRKSHCSGMPDHAGPDKQLHAIKQKELACGACQIQRHPDLRALQNL